MEEKRAKILKGAFCIFLIVVIAGLFDLFANWMAIDFIKLNLEEHHPILVILGYTLGCLVSFDFIVVEYILFNILNHQRKHEPENKNIS